MKAILLLVLIAYIPLLNLSAEITSQYQTVAQLQPISQSRTPMSMDNNTGSGAKDYTKDYTLYTIGDIIVNPATPDRFFVTTVTVEHRQADKKLQDELKAKTPIIKDRMLRYFARLTVEDLRDNTNREVFRSDLILTINGLLLEGRVTDLFFDQFVIQ